eukprot:83388-Alexandrium_andersonii.AAC.1
MSASLGGLGDVYKRQASQPDDTHIWRAIERAAVAADRAGHQGRAQEQVNVAIDNTLEWGPPPGLTYRAWRGW